MAEPWVLPVARDFVPEDGLHEVALAALLEDGLSRRVSFYIAHTMLAHGDIAADKIYLENQFAGFSAHVEPAAVNVNHYRRGAANGLQIPEHLWHSFLPHHLVDYQFGVVDSDVELLQLEFEIKIDASAFEPLSLLFQTSPVNTLPLHLYHQWTYRTAAEESVDGTWIAQEGAERHVTNVWKDFVVVRREDVRTKLRIAIASDFHHSERNSAIHVQHADSEDIDGNVRSFANAVERQWRKGLLDYLVLNGDMIDYFFPASSYARQPRDLLYAASNWLGFEDLIKLLGWSPWLLYLPFWQLRTHGLLNVPILWNVGDHDRRLFSYPLPDSEDAHTHYDFYGLDSESASQANLSFVGSVPTFSAKSNPACLRYVYERSRRSQWPCVCSFQVGRKCIEVYLADTGPLCDEDVPPDQDALLTCTGRGEELIEQLQRPGKQDFTVIITHSPPVCLPADDDRLDAGGPAPFNPRLEGGYGSFKRGRSELIDYLGNKAAAGEPVAVVSGHVHFRSAYWLADQHTGWTGQAVWDALRELRYDIGRTSHFWKEHPILLVTTGPVGPKPIRSGPEVSWLRPRFIRRLIRLAELAGFLRRASSRHSVAVLCFGAEGLPSLEWF
jgi:hypothetical protein